MIRLYSIENLAEGASLPVTLKQIHYLKNVMRLKEGDTFLVFNEREGEWIARISLLTHKFGLFVCLKCLRPSVVEEYTCHLIYPVLKASPHHFLLEKACELGVTDLHPVITERTISKNISIEKIRAHIIEACEQCERLSLPRLHVLTPLSQCLSSWPALIPIIAAIERAPHAIPFLTALTPLPQHIAFMIGPEGGFTPLEQKMLASEEHKVHSVTLGPLVLRAETAALMLLATYHSFRTAGPLASFSSGSSL